MVETVRRSGGLCKHANAVFCGGLFACVKKKAHTSGCKVEEPSHTPHPSEGFGPAPAPAQYLQTWERPPVYRVQYRLFSLKLCAKWC